MTIAVDWDVKHQTKQTYNGMPRGAHWPSHRVVELGEEGLTQEDRKSSQHEGKMVDKDVKHVKHLHIPIYHEDCYKAGVDPGFLERGFTCIKV